MNDEQKARWFLILLAEGQPIALTPPVALILASHLLHLCGGDGRGVYSIAHNPPGDQVKHPTP